MDQRRLGSSDLSVSVVGMGCNNFSRPGTATETYGGSERVIHAAVDAGITFFDGADIYGGEPGRSEEFLGRALAGERRDRVVLATKFGHQNRTMPGSEEWGPKGGTTYVRQAVDASLLRLGTDRIDLLQMHTPDPLTPIGVTLEALTALVDEGKVRHVGHSNFTPAMAREADRVSAENGFVRFVSAQNQYSLLHREPEVELLPACEELGLGFLPFFPLASGLLTGKYSRDSGEGRLTYGDRSPLADVDWDRLDAYRRLCDDAGLTPVQAAVGWLLSRGVVSSVIAGATRVEQVAQNVAAGEAHVAPGTVAALDALFTSADR